MGDMTPAERIADLDDQLAAQEIMLRDLRDERDALSAVTVRVKAIVHEALSEAYDSGNGWDAEVSASALDEILSTAPATVLAQVKADAWDEGMDEGYDTGMSRAATAARNPYRMEREAQ